MSNGQGNKESQENFWCGKDLYQYQPPYGLEWVDEDNELLLLKDRCLFYAIA